MEEVNAELEPSSGSSKLYECSEWTTFVSKTGTKWKKSKTGLEETCVNESLLFGMRFFLLLL